jgi:cephalosporin hydroxylase
VLGKGRNVGIDIEIRRHNLRAVEAYPLARFITLVELSPTDPVIVARVKNVVKPGETVLVILDSNHTGHHVLEELNDYAAPMTPGSYIVAPDGVILDVLGGSTRASLN